MANPWAGEVRLVIDGTPHDLRLTLGAMAELEAELEGETVLDLVDRIETGKFATRDILLLIVAGLRGGGWACSSRDLLSAEIDGGLIQCTKVAAQLLARAFALPET